MGFAISLSAHS